MAQLRFSPLSPHFHHHSLSHPNNTLSLPSSSSSSSSSSPPRKLHLQTNPTSLYLTNPSFLSSQSFKLHSSSGHGNNNNNGGTGGGGGGGNNDESSNDPSSNPNSSSSGLGILGLFLEGWRSRVAADPQFPFKVLMEELVGVTACVLGDMASRPNFGLNELDLVFSTLVVGSIINFTIMYLLAPTASATTTTLPSIFATCPKSHMFEPGPFSLMDRAGTLVYKGTIFAAVGLAAGLAGTLLSNGLVKMRKKLDPDFETPNKSPPIVLNALTWAAQMGVSSNLRYQTLNGVEFLLERGLSPLAFKSSVLVLRLVNNVLGGMSFVVLARLTGAQSVGEQKNKVVEVDAEKDKLVVVKDNNQSTLSSSSK